MITSHINNQLYQSSRPGYPSEKVSRNEVETWLDGLKVKGIQTIICLLTDEQLAFYDHLQGGLLEMYRNNGFFVVHHPVKDPAHYDSGQQELEDNLEFIFKDYQDATKPVLIHCSAGVDRSPQAARFIVEQLIKYP